MKKTTCLILCMVMALAGCSTSARKEKSTAAKPIVRLLSTENGSGRFSNTSGSISCVGSFTGCAQITNSATGTVWFTPPSGTTNGIATDTSGFSSPYVSMVKVIRNDTLSWCGTNSVSFPASSAKQYKFIIYIKNTPPPPSNGDLLTLSVQWQ